MEQVKPLLRLTKTGTGSGGDIYMEYILKNALIFRCDVGGTDKNVKRIIKNITISFVEIGVRYTPYDEDGNAQSPISVGFNTATNTKK